MSSWRVSAIVIEGHSLIPYSLFQGRVASSSTTMSTAKSVRLSTAAHTLQYSDQEIPSTARSISLCCPNPLSRASEPNRITLVRPHQPKRGCLLGCRKRTLTSLFASLEPNPLPAYESINIRVHIHSIRPLIDLIHIISHLANDRPLISRRQAGQSTEPLATGRASPSWNGCK